MVNLKHAFSAFAAVAMVGSLAANQASEITAVNAIEPSAEIQFNQPEFLKGDGAENVLDMFTPSAAKQKEETKKEEVIENNDKKGYVLITEGYLNLRTEPSVDSESAAQLECAAEVIIISEQDGWYFVRYNDLTGFAAKEYITESYEEANAALLEHFKYESGYINADGVNIRDAAGTEGTSVIDQADSGDLIFVIEHAGDEWLKVYYGKNYDVGYVLSSFVTIDDKISKDDVASAKLNRINDIAKDGIVSSGGAELNVRSMPDDKSEIVSKLSDGAKIRIISKGSKWTKIVIGESGGTAYVKTEYIMDSDDIAAKAASDKAKKEAEDKKQDVESKAAAKALTQNKSKSVNNNDTKEEEKTTQSGSVSGQSIVNEAKKYIGVKYVYGGNSPSTGFDCSGLVQYVCRKAGISVNRSSRSQYSNGVAVSRANLQPGDLVFFSKGGSISHVVIYAGNGQVIHAPRPGKTVCYASLSDICSYSNYVGARRVV